ncbi:hypothetical protein C8Q74DRAFT_1218906 [Fomes fomentarius]|nr:hypothetical protein C8Q74DRAFT_1218906 [Fomes fomentarius]
MATGRAKEYAILFEYERDENGETMLEDDGETWKLTDRAKRAQKAKLKRLFNTYHPTKLLPRKWIASNKNRHPPNLIYGWAYQPDFLAAYAYKHKLSILLRGTLIQALGKEFVIYGELTEAELADKSLQRYIEAALPVMVREHLEQRAGVKLSFGKPYTDKYSEMFVVWDNYNIEARHDVIEEAGLDVREALSILDDAMTECGHKTERLWWHDWDKIHDASTLVRRNSSKNRDCRSFLLLALRLYLRAPSMTPGIITESCTRTSMDAIPLDSRIYGVQGLSFTAMREDSGVGSQSTNLYSANGNAVSWETKYAWSNSPDNMKSCYDHWFGVAKSGDVASAASSYEIMIWLSARGRSGSHSFIPLSSANNGRIARQEVDHVHFHVIPKPAEGGAGLVVGWPAQKPSMDKLTKLHEEILTKL